MPNNTLQFLGAIGTVTGSPCSSSMATAPCWSMPGSIRARRNFVCETGRRPVSMCNASMRSCSPRPISITADIFQRSVGQAATARSDATIVISASGMASGGRVLHHLARHLPDPRRGRHATANASSSEFGRSDRFAAWFLARRPRGPVVAVSGPSRRSSPGSFESKGGRRCENACTTKWAVEAALRSTHLHIVSTWEFPRVVASEVVAVAPPSNDVLIQSAVGEPID